MQFRIGRIVLFGFAVTAAPALAGEAIPAAVSSGDKALIAPISAAAACTAMTGDDSATNPPTTMALARREFLDLLASDRTNSATLAGMLPRAGQQVAALIGAAPAGAPRVEVVLRRLGLDPQRFLGPAAKGGKGGPFIAANDPRVRTLQADAARQAAVAASFASIPAFLPVNQPKESSGFGYRSDPFHGGGAFHAGLDLTGRNGDAIHAAADGVVVRAGWWAGYGKVVVVDHGNGMETRYGHMSRFHVKAGDVVRQGEAIGAMGSTGRSTGTHLHFEIRLDGQPIDPQPFLDLASFGLGASAKPRVTAVVPANFGNEPFGPLASDDMVMASGRAWQARPRR